MNVRAAALRVARWFDEALLGISRIGRAGLSYLGLALAAPALAASAYWYLKGPASRLKLLDTNKVSPEDQHAGARYVFYAIAAVVVILLGVYLAYARRKKLSLAWTISRVGAFLTPLLAVPFVVALMDPGIEADKKKPFITLLFCAIVAAVSAIATYRIWRAPPLDEKDGIIVLSQSRRRVLEVAGHCLAWGAVLGLWIGYGWFFTKLAITNHHAMQTRTIDLGAYDNVFYQSSHGHLLGCSFYKGGTHRSAHFDPILAVLSPLYRIYPRTEFILGLQSFWCGAGVVPVYLIANRHLKSRFQSVMMAACYALHPALHGANMYEFHSLTLACMPILWALYFLQTRRFKLYWAAVALSLLAREDIPLMLAMVGIATLILPDSPRKTGFFTVVVCGLYFVLVKAFFMTSSDVLQSGSQSYSYAYYYSDMIQDREKGLSQLILSMVTNPTFAIRHAFTEPKVLYLLEVFLPLLFVPFAARSWRLTLLYGILFTTLATRTAVFSTHFQYSNAILPFMFAAAPIGIKAISEGRLASAYALDPSRLQRAVVIGALFASLAVSYKFGGMFENDSFRGGFVKVVRKLTPEQQAHYTWLEETKKLIPPRAAVGVTQKVGPHVSNRKDVFLYGQKTVQYVFVDEREIKGDRLKRHKKGVADGTLEVMSKRGTYALYKIVKAKPKPKQPDPDEDDDGAPENPEDVLGDEPKE